VGLAPLALATGTKYSPKMPWECYSSVSFRDIEECLN
jgi:hypothetical protein